MKYVFQFCIILAFSFAGEVLYAVLPLPVPSSIYGLALLLGALLCGLVKLEQIRETALFLTAVFPLMFVPAGVGIMDLWGELHAIWLPAVIAVLPITVLVMAASGKVTQHLCDRKGKDQGEANENADG